MVVPLPEADPLLAAVAARFPDAVRPLPAHVTLLYPFLPADALDDRVLAALDEVFADRPPLRVEFAECRRATGFTALLPDPAQGLSGLVGDLRRRWPDLLPYDGRFGTDVDPHLTVALNTAEATAEAVAREIIPEFTPIRAHLREARLIALQSRWQLRRRFEFTGS
ncbi:2'-5' RNA ligase superfamily protein [Saccharopolyspora antimicrobica]|uniref:2'-5' RNA ligase superfamily protein n=1 Tax=Saccharopolyspora antimicrobica TaxID=455193 RepID=A0A1I5LX58_9PSEU|nr:2'-5' RNA ligase superfamily protein [Saccharopolyspora antimicrobica]SFP01855.1 2'-5' RNA ligase superfamily protein [Saccharopolyspora antimicrobica]